MASFHVEGGTESRATRRDGTESKGTTATRTDWGTFEKKVSHYSVTGLSMVFAKGDDEKFGTDEARISFNQAVMTMILNCVGSGILFFPKVMANTGMVTAPLLCIVCAFVCTECGTIIAKGCTMAEEHEGVLIASYEEYANFVGGNRMENVITVSKNFAMLGFIIVYFGLVAEAIEKFVPDPSQPVFGLAPITLIRFGIVFPVFAGLAMMKTLSTLARFAILGIIAMAVECALLVGGSLFIVSSGRRTACENNIIPDPVDQCNWYTTGPPPGKLWISEAGGALSIFLFSYAILATIPSVRSQLDKPEELPSILRTSFGFCCILNIFIMSCGYYAFGGGVGDNQNNDVAAFVPLIGQIVAVAIIINLLLSTPLYSFCIISVFEASGDKPIHTPLTIPNICFRAGLILALALINAVLPYAMQVIGLVSSVFACGNNILFPLMFFYMAKRIVQADASLLDAETAPVSAEPVSGLTKVWHACVLVVGGIVLVFGVQSSLNTLLEKIAEDAGGSSFTS